MISVHNFYMIKSLRNYSILGLKTFLKAFSNIFPILNCHSHLARYFNELMKNCGENQLSLIVNVHLDNIVTKLLTQTVHNMHNMKCISLAKR